MDFISAREAADRWGISQRRVAVLCSEQRIKDAAMVGNMWIIPSTAEKPTDARSTRYIQPEKTVKPFLKWAGGKGQLLKEIEQYYPFESGITKYAEPFVGGGAVLFDILSKYKLDEVYISDVNRELINTYKAIRDDVDALIGELAAMQGKFIPMESEQRKAYYSDMRNRFNQLKAADDNGVNIEKAALMIFLNKTCFNGLFRVNKKGLFNVPMGSYKNPLICDEANLRAVSEKLQPVTIVCGDYRQSENFIDSDTFVYCDPPYRPLTETASFTAYSENEFGDQQQIELAEFVNEMCRKGVRGLLRSTFLGNLEQANLISFFDYSSIAINTNNAKMYCP